MPNKDGHRRFGNIRLLPSGRYQLRYPAADGRMRSHTHTFERKADAQRALSLIEAEMLGGTWADPQRGKVKLGDYASAWITQRPGLRVRTVDLYRWLLAKHIVPYLGDMPVARLTAADVRRWRATLIANGVSATMAAKAYRLLRAILMTAVEDDKILSSNPCRIRGAELVGRRPVGNIRQSTTGGYRLRFQRHGQMRTNPQTYPTRAEAERALHAMARAGRADYHHDRRYRALVLLAAFASLRWGEATALRRCDLDLDTGSVRVRAAYTERSNGEMVLGPPKSRAGRRTVGIPRAIIPDLRVHLATYAKPEPGALAFPGAKGGPLRRGNFNRSAAWPYAVAAIGMPGLHFHDLRHCGNTFAAAGGVSLKDLMARMGHDSERAALIYQFSRELHQTGEMPADLRQLAG